jgi:hypothetical protein
MTDFIIEDRSSARVFDMDPNGDNARALHPIFDCRFFPINTKVECSAILENDWVSNTAGNSTRDEAITYSLTAGFASPVAKAVNWKGDTSENLQTNKFQAAYLLAWLDPCLANGGRKGDAGYVRVEVRVVDLMKKELRRSSNLTKKDWRPPPGHGVTLLGNLVRSHFCCPQAPGYKAALAEASLKEEV